MTADQYRESMHAQGYFITDECWAKLKPELEQRMAELSGLSETERCRAWEQASIGFGGALNRIEVSATHVTTALIDLTKQLRPQKDPPRNRSERRAQRFGLLAASASAFDQKYDRLLQVVRAQEAWDAHQRINEPQGCKGIDHGGRFRSFQYCTTRRAPNFECDEGQRLYTALQERRREAGL